MAVLTVTTQTFEEEVLKADKPVLVDLWATWCGPCMMQGPIVDEVSEEVDSIKFCKIDVDQNIEIAQKYRVASIPTLLVFEGGEIVKKQIGLLDKAHLKDFLGV